MEINNKVVVITGGAGGIGLAIAKAFLTEKALSIISCWLAKFIPCLNLPTDPIIPDNLM